MPPWVFAFTSVGYGRDKCCNLSPQSQMDGCGFPLSRAMPWWAVRTWHHSCCFWSPREVKHTKVVSALFPSCCSLCPELVAKVTRLGVRGLRGQRPVRRYSSPPSCPRLARGDPAEDLTSKANRTPGGPESHAGAVLPGATLR